MSSSKIFWIILANIVTLSCAQPYVKTPQDILELPNYLSTSVSDDNPSNGQSIYTPVLTEERLQWSSLLENQELNQLIQLALKNNGDLHRTRLDMEIAQQGLISDQRDLYWPDLFLEFNAAQNGGDFIETENNYDLNVNLSYELNIWGQLSDARRSAAFNFAARQADFKATQQELIFSVLSAWHDNLAQQQLKILFSERVKNQEGNLQAIESRYNAGLTSALDVYLARNNLEQEKSNLEQQIAENRQSQRALHILFNRYPKDEDLTIADFSDTTDLKNSHIEKLSQLVEQQLTSDFAVPTKLVSQKPELQSSWMALLQANAELAVAHKARFPSFTLDMNARQSSTDIGNILNNGIFSWSIVGSILQPLLNSGDLLASENIALLEQQQAEMNYIIDVYESFQTIENALDERSALLKRWEFTQRAAKNARFAQDLALNQYQRGLVEYTTFLEAQRRDFDAQETLINLYQSIQINTALLYKEFVAEIYFQ